MRMRASILRFGGFMKHFKCVVASLACSLRQEPQSLSQLNKSPVTISPKIAVQQHLDWNLSLALHDEESQLMWCLAWSTGIRPSC